MSERSAAERFIERMGFLAEEDRIPRIAGRIVALLLLEDGSLDLDEVATRLRVSRASVSTNARLLQSIGAIDRVSRPGSRRDRFQIAGEPGRELLKSTARRMHERSRVLGETRHAISTGRAVSKRLADLERFYRAVGNGIDRAILEMNSR